MPSVVLKKKKTQKKKHKKKSVPLGDASCKGPNFFLFVCLEGDDKTKREESNPGDKNSTESDFLVISKIFTSVFSM